MGQLRRGRRPTCSSVPTLQVVVSCSALTASAMGGLNVRPGLSVDSHLLSAVRLDQHRTVGQPSQKAIIVTAQGQLQRD
jgi:hypothetical protein